MKYIRILKENICSIVQGKAIRKSAKLTVEVMGTLFLSFKSYICDEKTKSYFTLEGNDIAENNSSIRKVFK